MNSAQGAPAAPAGAFRSLAIGAPISERILARLGSPRWLWIGLWASTAIVAPMVLLAVLAATGESDRVENVAQLLVPQAVLVYVVALCLWGAGRLYRGSRALEPDLVRLVQAEPPGGSRGARATILGPLLLTAVVSFVNTATAVARYGPLPALVVAPFLAVTLLGIMTFVWTYLGLLLGLDRLGRARLELDPFPQDRSLGLKGVGSLAFTGFVILFAAAVPILVTSTSNVSTIALSLAVVGIVVAMFVLSMWRLHGQMAASKAGYVAETRALLATAYAPLRADPSVDVLAANAPALAVAQALADRAEKILQWPVDEGMTAWVAVIVTGVVTSLIVRLVFAAAGLG
jgi:hypothetical protein